MDVVGKIHKGNYISLEEINSLTNGSFSEVNLLLEKNNEPIEILTEIKIERLFVHVESSQNVKIKSKKIKELYIESPAFSSNRLNLDFSEAHLSVLNVTFVSELILNGKDLNVLELNSINTLKCNDFRIYECHIIHCLDIYKKIKQAKMLFLENTLTDKIEITKEYEHLSKLVIKDPLNKIDNIILDNDTVKILKLCISHKSLNLKVTREKLMIDSSFECLTINTMDEISRKCVLNNKIPFNHIEESYLQEI